MKINSLQLLIVCAIAFLSLSQSVFGQAPPIEPSILSKADISLSPRWYWYSRVPQSISDELDAYATGINEKADQFHANRYLWTYKEREDHNDPTSPFPDPSFPEVTANGVPPRSSQYAFPLYINPSTLDEYIINNNLPQNLLDDMLAINLCGHPLRSSWEIIQGWSVSRPDFNSTEFLDFQIYNAQEMVKEGNISFHQDNSGGNESWVNYGGSFNSTTMSEFNTWLNNNLSSLQLSLLESEIGVSNILDFDYRNYLITELGIINTLAEEPCNCAFSDLPETLDYSDPNIDQPMAKLKYYFREFMINSTKLYYDNLHNTVDQYINSVFPGKTGTYSANNLEQNDWLSPHFDFWTSEVYPKNNDEGVVYDIINTARYGRNTFYNSSNPSGNDAINAITLARQDSILNRTVVPVSYALGTTMIAPWDVYIAPISGAGQPRLYGDHSFYDDVFSLIRSQEDLFTNYNTLEEHQHVFLNYYDRVKSDDIYPQDPSRTVIVPYGDWVPQNIPSGSIIRIGDTDYPIIVGTGVGSIYVETSALPVGGVEGEPIYYFDIYNANNGSYTRIFDDSCRIDRPINNPDVDLTTAFVSYTQPRTNPNGTWVIWTETNNDDIDIPFNSTVMIGHTVYTTTVGSGNGNIYLDENVLINNGAPIWYIRGPQGNIIYPKESKPYAVTIRNQDDYEAVGVITQINQIPSPERTSISWSETGISGLSIPTGSKVLINDKIYHTIVNSGNATIHINSDEYIPEGTFNIGDPIWYVKDPNSNIIYPDKTYDNSVMHIVNLSENTQNVAVKIKKSLFNDAFTDQVTNTNQTISPTNQLIGLGLNTYAIYKINNLNKWAVLKQSSTRHQNTKTIGDSKDILLYPNPNDGNYTIKLLEQHKDATISVYNPIGQEVYKLEDAEQLTNINMSRHRAGIYVVKIETNDKVYIKKIIIK